ncbi:MAG: UsfY protein [Mycobacteriaceae bacterium]|nr:UsfY protein [Mycobacteriaceae bacterium]MBV9638459.1 UsfY protein [Mycobacteriaceae bacterium]
MADIDPTDNARTTIPRAGEAMKDTRGLPGYFLMGLAIVALVACLAAAGMSQLVWTIVLGVVAVLAAVGGSVWVYLERRRVARLARQSPPARG